MHHRMGRTLDCIKGLFNNVLSGLGQYLYGNVLRNHVTLNQSPDEIVLGVGGSRKAYLNLLETDIYQNPEEFQLFL